MDNKENWTQTVTKETVEEEIKKHRLIELDYESDDEYRVACCKLWHKSLKYFWNLI